MKRDTENSVKRLDLIWYSFSFVFLAIVTGFFKFSALSHLLFTPYIFLMGFFSFTFGVLKVVFFRSGKFLQLTTSVKIRGWFAFLASMTAAFWCLFSFNFPWFYRLAYFLFCSFFGFLNGLSLYKGVSLAFFHWVDQKYGESIRRLILRK